MRVFASYEAAVRARADIARDQWPHLAEVVDELPAEPPTDDLEAAELYFAHNDDEDAPIRVLTVEPDPDHRPPDPLATNNLPTAIAPDPGSRFLVSDAPGQAWVLHYRHERHHDTWLHRDPATAIARLATIVRSRWHTLTGLPLADTYRIDTSAAPAHDQAAVNLYFAALSGDREGYELSRETIDPAVAAAAGDDVEFVLGGVGGDWTCLCGNDASLDRFDTCDPGGEVVSPDADGLWDGVHYRCTSCDRIITQPTGRVVGRAQASR